MVKHRDKAQGDFFRDPEEEKEERHGPGEIQRCTPEDLWAYICETRTKTGRSPSLLDCKHRYGGILGVYVAGWELQRRGLL